MLAAAGLERLGRLDAVTELCGIDGWPTAPGQGALALEVREDSDREIVAAVAGANHGPTHTTVAAEREVLRILEAGCAAPIGATAMIDDGLLFLSARVYSPTGAIASPARTPCTSPITPRPPLTVASNVAGELLSLGAKDLVPLGSIS